MQDNIQQSNMNEIKNEANPLETKHSALGGFSLLLFLLAAIFEVKIFWEPKGLEAGLTFLAGAFVHFVGFGIALNPLMCQPDRKKLLPTLGLILNALFPTAIFVIANYVM